MKNAGNNQFPGKCLAIFNKISQYLDGELDPHTCQKISKHLEECFQCKCCLAMLQRTLDICRHLTPREVPQHLKRRLERIVPS